MEYESLCKIVEQAVGQLSELRLTSAFPGGRAESPLQSCICAVGLGSVSSSSRILQGKSEKTSEKTEVFAEVYTPFSHGGDYCCSLAVRLASMIEFKAEGESLIVDVEGVEYISGCRAFRCRISVKSEWQLEAGSEGEQGGEDYDTTPLTVNGEEYLCRLVRLETAPEEAVQCCGESYPSAFVRRSTQAELTVQRRISDDGKSLRGLSYPFCVSFGEISLSDCSLTQYSLEPGGEERLKISGREEADGQQ